MYALPLDAGHSWTTPPPNWALPDPKRKGANADVDNVLSLVDEVAERFPVQWERTLLLGYCEGALMALRLATHVLGADGEAGVLGGVAMLSGTPPEAVSHLPAGLRVYEQLRRALGRAKV